MGKLKLNLDEIKVESFEIINSIKKGGTVLAQDTGAGCLTPLDLCDPTLQNENTCAQSCPVSCNCIDPTEQATCVCTTPNPTCGYPCSEPIYTYCIPECLA